MYIKILKGEAPNWKTKIILNLKSLEYIEQEDDYTVIAFAEKRHYYVVEHSDYILGLIENNQTFKLTEYEHPSVPFAF